MTENDAAGKFALLGMLSLCPGSGYDIKKMVETSIGYFWSESYGRIYPLLKQLTKEGLIRPQREPNRSRRERQAYAITRKGAKALEEWLRRKPRLEPNRSELLLKMFFSGRVPAEVASAHVLERKRTEERNLASYARVEEQLRQSRGNHPELPYWLSTISYGRHRSEAIVIWCDETLRRFSQIKKQPNVKRGMK
jgi:PadR family transcriptional regulator, regulatory protein AphA